MGAAATPRRATRRCTAWQHRGALWPDVGGYGASIGALRKSRETPGQSPAHLPPATAAAQNQPCNSMVGAGAAARLALRTTRHEWAPVSHPPARREGVQQAGRRARRDAGRLALRTTRHEWAPLSHPPARREGVQQAGRRARRAAAQAGAVVERDRYGRARAGRGQQVPCERGAGKAAAHDGEPPARTWRPAISGY